MCVCVCVHGAYLYCLYMNVHHDLLMMYVCTNISTYAIYVYMHFLPIYILNVVDKFYERVEKT